MVRTWFTIFWLLPTKIIINHNLSNIILHHNLPIIALNHHWPQPHAIDDGHKAVHSPETDQLAESPPPVSAMVWSPDGEDHYVGVTEWWW